MVPLSAVVAAVERLAPPELAFGFDHIGLQVGSPGDQVGRVVVSLDSSLAAIRHAVSVRAQALVTHHPLIWDPITTLAGDGRPAAETRLLMKHGIGLVAAHTNWDCASGGINDVLAGKLGLTSVSPFGFAEPRKVAKIVVFVPPEHEEAVIDAMAGAGAGHIGAYSRCAFSSLGTGTFVAGAEADPFIGEPGEATSLGEARVEMLAPVRLVEAVVTALRRVHPYEEPAYDVCNLRDLPGQPAGRVGHLPHPMTAAEFTNHVDVALSTNSWTWKGHDRAIERVLVIGGAAADGWRDAIEAGCDAFVTGEVPQHVALEAGESGMTVLASGHYATENPGMSWMAEILAELLPVDVEFFDPEPGCAGRPV